MKALVTGADGFVAPYLIKELISKKYDVVGTYLTHMNSKLSSVPLIKLDVLDKINLKKVIDEHSPDIIFHLAAISNVKFSIDNPKLTMQINVEGTKNILEYSKKIKIVLIGSAEEYGPPVFLPITETHPLNPKNPYAVSKVLCELEGISYAINGGKVVLLRSFNHIGPGQSDSFVVSSFAKQISEIKKGLRKDIKVGNLSAKRDFTDVRDVVKAYVLASESCDYGVPYNVCSENSFEIKKILDKLIELSGVKVKIVEDPSRMRPSDIPILIGSYSLLNKKTEWSPKIKLEQSLKDIYDSFFI